MCWKFARTGRKYWILQNINTRAWRYFELGVTSLLSTSGHTWPPVYMNMGQKWSVGQFGCITPSNRRHQPPGSTFPTTQVQTQCKQVAPFSRLLRHARECLGPFLVSQPGSPRGSFLVYTQVHSMQHCAIVLPRDHSSFFLNSQYWKTNRRWSTRLIY